ncbi:MAG: glycosyltransferase family 2 protein [Acidimicrobiales bacterium]
MSQDLVGRCLELAAEVELLRAQNRGGEWMASRIGELEATLGRMQAEMEAGERVPPSTVGRRLDRVIGYVLRRRNRGRPPVSTSVGAGTGEAQDAAVSSLDFPEDRRYSSWVALYDTIDDAARDAIRQRVEALDHLPLVSVILPVFNTPENYLRQAIESIRNQIYQNWELCIADDCSSAAWVPKVLEEYAALDPRIRMVRREVNGHISEASNTALEMARGTWIALFDHDDVMAEHALALSVLALAGHPDAGILYSDEDHIDDDGVRSAPYFKPDFDPILLFGQNYFSHLSVIRSDLVSRAGRYRTGYEGSQDWDLVLRVVELIGADQVVHVPHVLYHWRIHPGSTSSSLSAKPYAAVAARRSVADHVQRSGRQAGVASIGTSSFNRIRWVIPEDAPRVTVVLLPRSGARLIRCLDSVRALTTYPNFELVVVDDGGEWPQMRAFFRDFRNAVRVIESTDDVSDATLLNNAVGSSTGDLVCFLHDDVEVVSDGWLEEMVGLVLHPGVGAVGAKLLYADGTVEHAGIVMGIGGTVGYVHRRANGLEPGYFGRAMLAQCFSAVSRSCMVVRRDAFESVGGFDGEHLSGAYLDVDLCLRLGEAGWRVAWTPFARLTHYESPTSPRETDGENSVRFAREIRHLQTRWEDALARDPAYNPNLSLAHETWPLAWPPRVSYR